MYINKNYDNNQSQFIDPAFINKDVPCMKKIIPTSHNGEDIAIAPHKGAYHALAQIEM